MALTSEQMYEVCRDLFDEFLADPRMVEAAARTGVAIQYQITEPSVKITVDNRAELPSVSYGETEVVPDVVVSMRGSVAHRFFMGQSNAADLFLKKQLSIRPAGQATRYIRLVPMFMGLLKRYPDVLIEKGLYQQGQQWLQES